MIDVVSNPGATMPALLNLPVIHLKTQDGPPYGSQRRCCERCGIMLWGQKNEPLWTDDRGLYLKPPKTVVRCDQAAKDSVGE